MRFILAILPIFLLASCVAGHVKATQDRGHEFSPSGSFAIFHNDKASIEAKNTGYEIMDLMKSRGYKVIENPFVSDYVMFVYSSNYSVNQTIAVPMQTQQKTTGNIGGGTYGSPRGTDYSSTTTSTTYVPVATTTPYSYIGLSIYTHGGKSVIWSGNVSVPEAQYKRKSRFFLDHLVSSIGKTVDYETTGKAK